MRVENYREQPHSQSVSAVFDVYVPALQMTLKNLKLVNKKDGGKFIAFPSFSQDRYDGKKDWIPYVSFSKEKQEEFLKRVWDELKGFTKDRPAADHRPTEPEFKEEPFPF